MDKKNSSINARKRRQYGKKKNTNFSRALAAKTTKR